MKLPLVADLGPREPKSIKENPDWKAEHKVLWDRFATEMPCTWPMTYPELVLAKNPVDLRREGLLPREREVTVLCHYLFKAVHVVEFLDSNSSAPRIVERNLSDSGERSSPWKPSPPTLVGSSKMVMRWTRPDKPPVLRTLECFELTRMIGWPDDCWRTIGPDDRSHDFVELVSNMCGNAYTMFHFGPWNIALLATYGMSLHIGESTADPANSELGTFVEGSLSSDSD